MEAPAEDNSSNEKEVDKDVMRALRHDVNNQLSNILLALEQLRYELPDANEDSVFYLDLIALSAAKINNLLKQTVE
jgi:hypothetical protein